MHVESSARRGFRFDGTIAVRDLLVVGTCIAGIVVWGLRLEGRIEILELKGLNRDVQLADVRADVGGDLDSIKTDIRDIKAAIEKLFDRRSNFMPMPPPEREALELPAHKAPG